MKNLILSSIAIALLMPSWTSKVQAQPNSGSGSVQFACGEKYDPSTGQYFPATLAWNSRHKKAIVIWQQEAFSNAGFDPLKRCQAVSPRFQEAYQNNSLKFLTHGQMNGQEVICTSPSVGEECETLLLTLLPQDDALQTLEDLYQVLLGGVDSPLKQSSDDGIYEQQGQIYVEVDIDKFLDSQ